MTGVASRERTAVWSWRIGAAVASVLNLALVEGLTAQTPARAQVGSERAVHTGQYSQDNVPERLGENGVIVAAKGAPLTARDVTTILFKAGLSVRVDLSDRTMRNMDLSGLDFKGARLTGSDLWGSDLTSANLRGTDLSNTVLDRTTIIKSDFSGANLSNATLMRPNTATSFSYDVRDAAKFTGANMEGIRLTAHMQGADFRRANLTRAKLGPHEPRADISSMPNAFLESCDFSGATMTDIDLSRAVLTFSRFVGADLRHANLDTADLSRVDLAGADLTGADLTNANLDGANVSGVKGFEAVKGRETIRNLERTIR